MAWPLIMAGIQTGMGIISGISGMRAHKKAMGPLREMAQLQLQTARGGGPLIESTVGGITRAGELQAQRASRAGGGRVSEALRRTLANQARIGGMRAAGQAAGALRAAALTGGGPAAMVAQMGTRRAEAGIAAGGESLGWGITNYMRYMDRLGAAKDFTPTVVPPVPQAPTFQYGYKTPFSPGAPTSRFGTQRGAVPGYGGYLFGNP